MTDFEKLAQLLFPNTDKTPEFYEELYPQRELPEGAKVTRFAPSPTGFLHFGNLHTELQKIQTAFFMLELRTPIISARLTAQ